MHFHCSEIHGLIWNFYPSLFSKNVFSVLVRRNFHFQLCQKMSIIFRNFLQKNWLIIIGAGVLYCKNCEAVFFFFFRNCGSREFRLSARAKIFFLENWIFIECKYLILAIFKTYQSRLMVVKLKKKIEPKYK